MQGLDRPPWQRCSDSPSILPYTGLASRLEKGDFDGSVHDLQLIFELCNQLKTSMDYREGLTPTIKGRSYADLFSSIRRPPLLFFHTTIAGISLKKTGKRQPRLTDTERHYG